MAGGLLQAPPRTPRTQLAGEQRRRRRSPVASSDSGTRCSSIGGGVVGVLANGAGKTVLMRADMDALPVAEMTGSALRVDRDRGGRRRGTGRRSCTPADTTSTSPACSAPRSSWPRSSEPWSGTFIALFQPAEETAAGARAMVDDGLTGKIPRPDVAFGQHVLNHDAGVLGTQAGPVLSAGDSVKITVFGRGSHGSMPHLSVDPVVLAASIVLRLQTIVSRARRSRVSSPSSRSAAASPGTKSNIIPDRAVLLVNLRTYDMAVRQKMVDSIERIVAAECTAVGFARAAHLRVLRPVPADRQRPRRERHRDGCLPCPLRRRPGHVAGPGHRQRGLQPDPRRIWNPVHLLGRRRVPAGRQCATQPLPVLRAADPAHTGARAPKPSSSPPWPTSVSPLITLAISAGEAST